MGTTEFSTSLSAVISTRKTRLLIKTPKTPTSIMGRNQGNRDLIDLQKGGVLALKININLFNRRIAKS